MPLMEILDLSWNSGVGGGALRGSPLRLEPSLRELHLVSCQLTAADAALLGTGAWFCYHHYISHNPPHQDLVFLLVVPSLSWCLHCRVFVSVRKNRLRAPQTLRAGRFLQRSAWTGSWRCRFRAVGGLVVSRRHPQYAPTAGLRSDGGQPRGPW